MFLTSNPTRHNAGTYKVGHSSVAWAQLSLLVANFGFTRHIFHLRYFLRMHHLRKGIDFRNDVRFFYVETWRILQLPLSGTSSWYLCTTIHSGGVLCIFKNIGQAHLPKEANLVMVIELRWCHRQRCRFSGLRAMTTNLGVSHREYGWFCILSNQPKHTGN